MNVRPEIRVPALRAQQLIDVYRAGQGTPSPWVAISDQVMGGISTATLRQCERSSSVCTCLAGRTHLEHNGGFVQMKLELEPSRLFADYAGLFIELCGAAHEYNLHVKTQQLDKPWQSFRCRLSVEPQWTRFNVPYAQLLAYRTDAELHPASITSVAVVAIGTAFDVDVCVRRFGFFQP